MESADRPPNPAVGVPIAQDKFGGLILRYPPKGAILAKEKFNALRDDEVQLWLETEEIEELSNNKCVRSMVFDRVLARKNFPLLKYTCEKLKITAKETYATLSAADNAGFPETLRYLDETYWKGHMSSLVIEELFYRGASASEISSVANIIGMPHWTCSHTLLGLVITERSDQTDLFAWFWNVTWPIMAEFFLNMPGYITREKQKKVDLLVRHNLQDMLSWVRANDPQFM